MYRKTKMMLLGIGVTFALSAHGANRPFPQELTWSQGIKPQVSQQEMNQTITSLYDYWKTNYLKVADTGGYFVQAQATGGDGKGQSEGHGWGMVITALMAGYDSNAKTYFDGLYQFFDSHRSNINPELMGWLVDHNETGTGRYSSATDGDMDIAYGLLLAHGQWGSDGAINYRQEAVDMINQGIKVSLLNSQSKRLMMGDWDTAPLSTRSSDWMLGHLRSYKAFTGDSVWDDAIATIYSMVNDIQSQHSPNTGLLPDFATGDPVGPDHNNATGEPNSGAYYWNAARTPWRLATDYLHYGTVNAQSASNKLVNWAKTIVGSQLDFNQFLAGYHLNGQSVGNQYSSIAYIAPLVVASATDAQHQAFLNAGWQYIKDGRGYYFQDSINLLCMLLISGNWWTPESVPSGNTPPNASISPATISVAPGDQVTFDASGSSDADSDPLSFSWQVDSALQPVQIDDQRLSVTAPSVTQTQTFDVVVAVSDGQAARQAVGKLTVNSGTVCGVDPDAGNYPAWQSTVIYTQETVSHNQLVWQAKWWNQGVEPDFGTPWRLVSNVELPWNANRVYNTGDEANYQDSRYRARWWVQGQTPDTSSAWERIGPSTGC